MKKEPSAPISGYSSSHLRPQARLLAGRVTTPCVHPTGPGVPDAPLLLPAHLSPFGPRGSSPRIPQSRTSACGGFIGSVLRTLVGRTRSGLRLASTCCRSWGPSPQPAGCLPPARVARFAPACGPGALCPIGTISFRHDHDIIVGAVCQPLPKNFFSKFLASFRLSGSISQQIAQQVASIS